MVRRIIVMVSMLALLLPGTALAQDPESLTPAPDSISDALLDTPVTTSAVPPSRMDASLLNVSGPQAVVVRLKADAVAEVAADGRNANAQKQQLRRVEQQQDKVLARARQLDPDTAVLGSAQRALNAIMLRIDASALAGLATSPDVERISPVVDFELDLSETVPYIGATAAQDAGFTGEGIRVAVLDSGIDYTHAALGGDGVRGAYDVAYGSSTNHQANKRITDRFRGELLFPTDKVVGGFDFVGEVWPFGPLQPDPDPIDCGFKDIKPKALADAVGAAQCSGGHGTHVADIIGGAGGVAPAAQLYAVKVCSAVSTSCSGVALIQGMDFAVDPNGDGSTDDAVDIINMSLGSPYGQAFFDDLSQAVENATGVGVLTVASAGNSADKPYITGSPAAAPSAISVAQTNVPSATQDVLLILTPPAIAGPMQAVFQPWSQPLSESGPIEGSVQYGDGAGGNLNGCAAFAAGSLTGLIVLIDRGACDFSLKVSNVALGGGAAALIGLVAPGDPFQGGLGLCDACDQIPGFQISQADSNAIKGQLGTGVTARLSSEDALPLIGHMVGSSSRGPSMGTNQVKPEIGAPGASVSAVAGQYTATEAFGGTSGAAPMVSGSAALVLDAFGDRSPAEVKAVLMNTADTEIQNAPAIFGGGLAPVSRIGGGEVRVDAAINSPVAAWDTEQLSAVLSFGFHDVTDAETVLTRQVTVRNYSDSARTYAIANEFRFADDAGSGAVSVAAPGSVDVPAKGTATFDVTLTIDGAALARTVDGQSGPVDATWLLNSGGNGANGNALTAQEFDGYLRLVEVDADGEAGEIHVGWHVLPRQAGDVEASASEMAADGSIDLTNNGVGTARVATYSLIGESPDIEDEGSLGGQNPVIDLKSIGVQTFGAGACSSGWAFGFAVATWERQTHANAPAAFEFDIDTDGDGAADYAIFNLDVAGNLSDGRNAVFVADLNAGTPAVARFLTLHATNAATTVLLVCGEQIGLGADDLFTPITGEVLAVDIYFTGNVTDVVEDLAFAPLGERYVATIGGEPVFGTIPSGATEALTVEDFGPEGTNGSETGVLLLYNANFLGGSYSGAPEGNDSFAVTITEE